jgi:hypothetical protein
MMKGRLRMPKHPQSESGVILVLSAISLVVIMGIAAFAVDLGWIAYNQLEARKAAEAGALAGVVHMPLPSCADPASGTAPYVAAVDTAGRNGYTVANGDTVTPSEGGSCARLKVTVGRSIPTFFMRLFGYDSLNVTESAIAEQLPILKLGSDEAQLGANGGADQLWVAINGEDRKKEDGDPFSTRCGFSCSSSNVGPGPLQEFRDPAYYYAVEVPDGQSGSLSVEIYDGTHFPRSSIDVDTGELGGDDDFRLRFSLYPPDSTPNDWTDNSAASSVCSETFYFDDTHSRPAGWGVNSWTDLLSCPSAVAGTYVLEVRIDGDEDSLSAFGIRARVGGTQNVAVYGLGAMSLWMNKDNSAPVFKMVRVDPVYAGAELEIGLFDPGDANGLARMSFTGALSGYDCLMQVTDENGVVSDWHSDGWWNNSKAGGAGDWAGTSCGITTSQSGNNKIYNGDWIRLRFTIPSTHDCSNNGGNCWSTVNYNFSNSPFDRTTWTAKVNGTPVHLVP